VEAVYLGESMGRYITVTAVKSDGNEISGLALIPLQAKLGAALPPAA
jgi:hypothetical protein